MLNREEIKPVALGIIDLCLETHRSGKHLWHNRLVKAKEQNAGTIGTVLAKFSNNQDTLIEQSPTIISTLLYYFLYWVYKIHLKYTQLQIKTVTKIDKILTLIILSDSTNLN